MSKESRIDALKAAAENKKKQAEANLDKAIQKLTADNKPLTFANIARVAGLSVSYLYKYPEIKERIEGLREQQQKADKPVASQKASENSKLVLIDQLRERIKKLEAEITGLRRVNEGLAGRVYHLQSADNLAERLKAENASFKARIAQLEQELNLCRNQSQPSSSAPTNSKVTSIEKKRTGKPDIADSIKQELINLGIQLNPTLIKSIKLASEETVINAIAAFKEALIGGVVEKPGAWVKRAIEEKWMPNEPIDKTSGSMNSEFNQWFDLARSGGIVKSKEETEEGFMLQDNTGQWASWESFIERGWTLDYLKNRVKSR